MIGSFGAVIFRTSAKLVQNFENLKRDCNARFANHEVINSKPKKEFLGMGLDTMSFSMNLSVFRGVSPLRIIDQLRAMATSGTEANFILGGRRLGKYVITSLSEGYEIITNQGKVLSVRVDVSMEEYK